MIARWVSLTLALALLACASLAFAQTGPLPGSGAGGSTTIVINTGTATNITGVLVGDGATISGQNPLTVASGGTATTTTTNGYVKIGSLAGVATYTVQAVPVPQTDGGTATATAINAFFLPRVASASGSNIYAASTVYDDGTTVTLTKGVIRLNTAGSATAPNISFNPGSGGVQNGFYSANGAIQLTVGGIAQVYWDNARYWLGSSVTIGFLSGACCGGSPDVAIERASPTRVNITNGTAATPFGFSVASGSISNGVAFSGLGGDTFPVGTLIYCTTCLAASNPCTGASTGTYAFKLGTGAWKCL